MWGRANMAHMGQSRPDYGLIFQTKVLATRSLFARKRLTIAFSAGARYPSVEGGGADALGGVARGQGREATPGNCRAQGDTQILYF